MSIYASWRGLDCEHEDDCEFWVETEPGCFEMGDPADCTCGLPRAPLRYAGSHVLPSDGDPKASLVIELASIPDHICREGRADLPAGTPKPWLRFSVYGEADPTCVLTRAHVEILRDELDGWLERFAPAPAASTGKQGGE